MFPPLETGCDRLADPILLLFFIVPCKGCKPGLDFIGFIMDAGKAVPGPCGFWEGALILEAELTGGRWEAAPLGGKDRGTGLLLFA